MRIARAGLSVLEGRETPRTVCAAASPAGSGAFRVADIWQIYDICFEIFVEEFDNGLS
jgi:hypothetical protein